MLFDINSLLSGSIAASGTRTPQAITATANSANVIDTRSGGAGLPALEDLGITGPDVWLVVNVVQAFNTLTSLTIALVSDSATNLATSPVTHYTKTILLAALTANTQVICVQLPADSYKQYLGLTYTVTGSNPTQGTLYAFLTLDPQRYIGYPGAYTVDV